MKQAKRNRPGDSRDELTKLRRAAALHASGQTFNQIAAAVSCSVSHIRQLRLRNPEVWHHAYEKAAAALVEEVQAAAGTDLVASAPDEFFTKAKIAERWVKRTIGEGLFPSPALPTNRDARADDYTLPSFFESYYLPVCGNELSPQSIELYRKCLQRWRLMTGNPRLSQIDNTVMARFRDALLAASSQAGKRKGRPMSVNTVRMYLRNVQVILDKAGMPGPRRRDAAGLVTVAPWAKPPREALEQPGIVSESRLSACYVAAVCMSQPQFDGFKPAAWWRALLVVAYNLGLRARTLFALRMAMVNWKDRLLSIPAECLKGRKSMVLPLNDVVMRHLLAIRTDREIVFPWPFSREMFRKHFHRLQFEAGIPPLLQFGLHAIRRTAGTVLWQIDPAVAQLTLGHSSLHITKDHYVNAREVLVKASNSMPQPAAFTKGGGL